MEFLFFILGSVFIFYGSNILIDNAKLIALSLKVSSFVIGLTLVAFGTSLPELVVSTMASYNGDGDIVLGNIIGSNIANIGLVLSVIVILKSIKFNYFNLKNSLYYIVLSSIILLLAIVYNKLSMASGLVFLFLFHIYLYQQFMIIKNKKTIRESTDSVDFQPKYAVYLVAGVCLLALGSDLFIKGAIGIAEFFEIPLIIISLSVVALGTSIPELATSLIAIKKNESNLLIGNILGSNIINIVLVLGISVIINPINVYTDRITITHDVVIALTYMIIVTIILLYIIFFKDSITRAHGTILFTIYIMFIYFNFI